MRDSRALILCTLLLCLGAAAQPDLDAPARLTLGSSPPVFVVEAAGVPLPGELVVLNGETSERQALPSSAGSPLDVSWRLDREGNWNLVTVTLASRAPRQLRLEVGMRLTVPRAASTYFDGRWAQDVRAKVVNAEFVGRFPLTCASSSDLCVALGLSPDQWLSYLRHSIDPGDPSGSLETATRIVLDPGDSETLRFLVGAFATPWGHLEALHWYYTAYPALFRPHPDVDPRASLNGGSYLAWSSGTNPEMCRRLRVGWEWCYAPFRRTGDIVGRPELWEYTPAHPMTAARSGPREEYLANRKRRFAAGLDCDVAMMFYIPSQIWCEDQLALERYSDALTTDSAEKIHYSTPWVTGHDNAFRVFPLNTTFGEQSRLDMAQVAAENNVQGFAFDTCRGGARYYGPAVNLCEGRAWDERGVFVDEGVAIAKLMDWCHENRSSEGRPLAVVSNPGGSPCYLTPLHSDAAMIETDPTCVGAKIVDGLRICLGQKTLVFWETYKLEELLALDRISVEDMQEALRGLADYTIIASLRVAGLPAPRIALGIRKLSEWMPLLAEIATAGWQPVPAANGPENLILSRAGLGLRQFVMGGNETPETAAGDVTVDSRWMADGAVLFMPEGAASASNRVRGRDVAVPVSVPSRGALVLRSVAALSAEDDLEIGLSRESDLNHSRVILDVTPGAGPVATRVSIPDWGEMELLGIWANGESVDFTACEGGWSTAREVTLAGRSLVELLFRSRVFDVDGAELRDFPWVNGDQPGFEIVLPDASDPQAAYAARRLAEYFPFYFANAVKPAVRMAAPPVLSAPSSARTPVYLFVDPGADSPARISPTSPGWIITGRTGADLRRAVFALVAELDRLYPYGGGLMANPGTRALGLQGVELQ